MKHAYFQANAALIAAIAVSTEETRYYLNGVHVEPNRNGGVNLVATDGHRMMVVYDQHGFTSEPMIVRIPQRKLKERVKWGKDYQGMINRMLVVRYDDTGSRMDVMDVPPKVVNPDDPKGEMIPFDLMGEVEKIISRHLIASETDVVIDGTFPDWRRVLPTVSIPKKGMAAVNPKYLKDFILPFEQSNGWFSPTRTPPSISMQSADALSAVQVLYTGSLAKFAYGVVMPISHTGFEKPAFIDFVPPATPEEIKEAQERMDQLAAEAGQRNPLAVTAEIHHLPKAKEPDAPPARRRHRLPTADAA